VSRVAVVAFPGSNCDRDVVFALGTIGVAAEWMWHTELDLTNVDGVVLPGGFSYGDYLRSGALAAHSPAMPAIRRFAAAGGPVLGICNGFQILCEAGLLPGALGLNVSRRFVCAVQHVRVASPPLSLRLAPGDVLTLPIAHREGRYYAPPSVLAEMWRRGQVVLQYCNADGEVDPAYNPNGSLDNIAGIANAAGNVVGLMPHPERAMAEWFGSADGRRFLLHWAGSGRPAA
jgi:phosphoribosylformylglycinamidine synthase I